MDIEGDSRLSNQKKTINLYNTASRSKEEFKPQNYEMVTFYSCGQTVYEDVHVGNAKTYVVWDILKRTLRHFGYKVKHVQNFTDVGHLTDDADQGEDKIEQKARELKEHPMELVDRQIREYHEVMDAINVERPNVAPRATGHIPEMIELVETLIDKEHAYNVDNSIYYDVSTFDKYGEMAKLDLKQQKAGARIEVNEDKKNPLDFALWIKAPKEHIMQYQSPWGKGYPGWHLECSVMAMKYLGNTLDIHSGGIDHIPVHHTNEIAQSEGATGEKFVNYWLHSEFITIDGEKMSKSLKNFITLEELIKAVGAGAARYTLSNVHYRTQADFSMEKAEASKKRYDRLIKTYQRAQQAIALNPVDNEELENKSMDYMQRFDNALADDLNTPLGFTIINELEDEMGELLQKQKLAQLEYFIETFETMMNTVGVPLIQLETSEIEYIEKMVEFRIQLRQQKKYAEADSIRDFLQLKGYVLEDQGDQTIWFKPEISE